MARSRRTICGHADDGPEYRVEEVVGYTAPDPAALQEALQHLADVLNALPGPVDGALSEMTPQLVHAMLSRSSMHARTHALRALGMPKLAPRRIPQTLCRDILGRLGRVHVHDAMHASTVLTVAPRRLLRMTAMDRDEDADTDPVGLPEWETEWPAPILQLALWSSLNATVADARLLLWAGTRPWWLPTGLSDAHGEAVLAAARQVVDASPDFTSFETPFTDDVDLHPELVAGDGVAVEAEASDSSRVELTERSGALGVAEREPEKQLTEKVATGTEPTMPTSIAPAPAAPPESSAAAEGAASARREREQLTLAQVGASAAASRLLSDIDDGLCPDDADLAAVAAFGDRLRALALSLDHMEEAISQGRPSIDTVDAALARVERLAELASVSVRLEALRRLNVAAPNPALATQLAALSAILDEVGANAAHAEPHLVAALLALSELAELLATVGAAQADPTELMNLQAQAVGGLPGPLALLPVAVLTGQLVLNADLTIPTPASGTVKDGTVSEDPDPERDVVGDAPAVALPTIADVTAVPASNGTSTELARGVITPEDPGPDSTRHEPAVLATPPETLIPAAAAASNATTERAASGVAAGGHQERHETETVANLVVERRFGLAAAIADAAGWAAGRGHALRLAALADAVRGETGPSAARLRVALSDVDGQMLVGESATLLLAAPALMRAALVIGDPTAGALLTELAPRLPGELALIAEQIGRRALQGVLIGNPLRTVLADVTELEARLEDVRAAAAERLARPNMLRFKRATDIAHRWLAPDGILGSLLSAAATDDRSKIGSVTASALQLADHGTIAKEIDTLDRLFKGNSGKPIEGASRQNLFALASDALAQVSAWLEVVAALRATSASGDSWATGELMGMRTIVLEHADAALTALDEQTPRDDAVAGAAVVAARASLEETFALLGGTRALPPGEMLPDVALTAELLKIKGASVEPTSGFVTPPDGTDVGKLCHVAALDWPAAFAAKLEAEEYPAAEYLLTALPANMLPGRGQLDIDDARRRLAAAEHSSRDTLEHERAHLLAELRRARLQMRSRRSRTTS